MTPLQITRLRKKLDMTQPEMAAYMQWSVRKQRMIESGESALSLAEIAWMKQAKKPVK